MKSLQQRYLPGLKIAEKNRRVDPALGISRGDPDLQKGYYSRTDQGRFSMIGKLESSVSLIQTANLKIDKTKGLLLDMKQFLEEEGYRSFRAQIPVSVINNYLPDRLNQIKMTTESAGFQNKSILNGKCGVRGKTNNESLRFVEGSARIVSSSAEGFPVTIYKAPKASILVGTGVLTSDMLKKERTLAFADDIHEIHYQIGKDENKDTLLSNLQRYLLDNGFDINVYCTNDNHLIFRHNQFGSGRTFKGMSYQTNLISHVPGEYTIADPGQDIEGNIAQETAEGKGGFLTGDKGNLQTDGLKIYFDGDIERPGQIVGYVKVKQNGIKVPIDMTGSKVEILSIPSICPESLAVGVTNNSGFKSLENIRANTVSECRDALKLIKWSIEYLEYLQDELTWSEKNYVNRAVELLRSTMSSNIAGEEILFLSKEKAKNMVGQLKGMLTPEMIKNVNSWN